MMPQYPARQALIERSVNTFGTGYSPDIATKINTGSKRRINNVDNPEYPPSPLRFRVTQDSPKNVRPTVITENACISTARVQTVDMEDEIEEGDSQETLKDSESSFSSQQTSATETSQVRSAASVHAEKLRLRLQVAMYKIRTDQTNIPMSQLVIAPKFPQPPTQAPQFSSRTFVVPRLLPAPLIEPSPFSARMTVPLQMPSSPPQSQTASPEERTRAESKKESEIFRTPALPKHQKPGLKGPQLSSPPSSQRHARRNGLDEENELTSSAKRGSAARGLLGLMQG